MLLRPRACRYAAALAVLGTALAGPAEAVTRTGTLAVTATVGSARDAAGSIGYAGRYNAAMTFALGTGANASGTTRNMRAAGSALLRYEIYGNTGRTTVFATGTAGLPVTTTAVGDGTVPIHGRIFASQVVPTGNYADTVAITLTF